MSSIAAIITDKFAVMAADSGTSPGIKISRPSQKIFLLADGSLLGGSGEIGTIRKLARDWNGCGAFDSIPKNEWISGDIDALVVSPDLKAFEITGPHSIIPLPSPGFCAVGSGGDVSLGVLYALLHNRDLENLSFLKASAILRLAIKAACDLIDGCRGPVRLRHIALTKS